MLNLSHPSQALFIYKTDLLIVLFVGYDEIKVDSEPNPNPLVARYILHNVNCYLVF